jgi:diaminohydroxyphosphoribosylaminopyrimidine deaminase/5-amino-6-(5-phosphoribosylamino)uracil reductase
LLDAMARTPLKAQVVADKFHAFTMVVVSRRAPRARVAGLAKRVRVIVAPERQGRLDLRWLMKKFGSEGITSLLVEGGGEVNASFLLGGWTQRVAFFYAPKILGGRDARKAVAGEGIGRLSEAIRLEEVEWRKLGTDLLLTGRVAGSQASG